MFPPALPGGFRSWGHIPQAPFQRRKAPSGLPHDDFEIVIKVVRENLFLYWINNLLFMVLKNHGINVIIRRLINPLRPLAA